LSGTPGLRSIGSPAHVRGELERIWNELLNTSDCAPASDFFQVMGDSLLASQLALHLQKTFQIPVPLQTIFELPTWEALAAHIEEQVSKEASSTTPAIRPVTRSGRLCLSHAQQRLWTVNQLDPASGFYNMSAGVRICGDLCHDQLRSSLNELAARHEPLRTSFHPHDEEVWQEIVSQAHFPLCTIDISNRGPNAEAAALAIIREAISRPFDLTAAPLARGMLLQLEEREHVLVLTMHHIVSDDRSMTVLLEELFEIYRAAVSREGPRLSPLQLQYADYAAWQRHRLAGNLLEEQIEIWRERLRGAPVLCKLPADRPRPPVPTYGGESARTVLSADRIQGLRDLCAAESATLFMGLVAIFQLLLWTYSGEADFLVGIDVANRPSLELSRMVGFFVNLLPMRADLSGDPSFRRLLAVVRHRAIEAYQHQDVPFERIVQELRPDRSLASNPILQVLCVLHEPSFRAATEAFAFEPFAVPHTRTRFDLVQFLQEEGDTLVAEWLYSTDLFDADTVAGMGERWATLVREVVARPDARISALDLRTAADVAHEQAQKLQSQREKRARLLTARRSAPLS
jgi:acyl carrier protein